MNYERKYFYILQHVNALAMVHCILTVMETVTVDVSHNMLVRNVIVVRLVIMPIQTACHARVTDVDR